MKQRTREPNILRLLVCLPALQIFFVFFLRRPVEVALGIEAPMASWLWVTLTVPLFLVAYTLLPWWVDSVGRVYLPSFLVITSLYIILEKYLTLRWFIPPALQALGAVLLTLKLWAIILLITLLVAWQYSRGWVLLASLLLCIVDGMLNLPFLRLGAPFYALTLILAFARLLFITSVAVGAQWLVDRQRQQSAALTEANLKLVQYAATSEQLAASHERNRLARELHDTLAHSLSGVAVQLQAVQALWELNPSQARQNLDRALQATESGLTEARRALQALRASPLEDLGLTLAVSDLAKSTAARANLRLDLTIQNRLEKLALPVEQCIYRVAQESLTNVARHAEATWLRVSLGHEAGTLALTISDDGRGFDPAAVNGAHYGLRGLRERAELIGATLQVTSAYQTGTTVRLLVTNEEAYDSRGNL
jgi:signal transduction histidine kinase